MVVLAEAMAESMAKVATAGAAKAGAMAEAVARAAARVGMHMVVMAEAAKAQAVRSGFQGRRAMVVVTAVETAMWTGRRTRWRRRGAAVTREPSDGLIGGEDGELRGGGRADGDLSGGVLGWWRRRQRRWAGKRPLQHL